MQLNISPRIVKNVATLYNDTNRIFMEYIDNSIDSAEEFFNNDTNSYNKNIYIDVVLDTYGKKVTINDNCYGITNFRKVIESVGDSDKKEQPWTNGQFGFGIYSFLAACESIHIKTKLKEESIGQLIKIERKQFDKDDQKDVVFPEPFPVNFPDTSGTEVTLSDFDKNMYKQIKFDVLKTEIEKHFELLLKRNNLTISITEETRLPNRVKNKNHTCSPFDYDSFDGDEYIDSLEELQYKKGGKNPTATTIKLTNPIEIYLKITQGKVIQKPPVFISKGRRVGEIKDIKGFKSKYKSEIWAHPSITGYVDLSDFLGPTIARNDYRNSKDSTALFSTIEELEPLILDVIKDSNKETESQGYKNLESYLNKELSKLAKIDALNFRTEVLSGKDINLESDGSGQELEAGLGTEHHRDGPLSGVHSDPENNPNEDPDGFGPFDDDGRNPSDNEEDGNAASNKEADNPFEDTGFKGGERKKSGFDIQFVDGEQFISVNGKDKQIRSLLVAGSIRIFREHPEFQKRITYSRSKEARISQRLITYLAGEITVHYKDKIQTREGQAEYDKQMFENLVEFIYQFEDAVSGLSGKSLSSLGN